MSALRSCQRRGGHATDDPLSEAPLLSRQTEGRRTSSPTACSQHRLRVPVSRFVSRRERLRAARARSCYQAPVSQRGAWEMRRRGRVSVVQCRDERMSNKRPECGVAAWCPAAEEFERGDCFASYARYWTESLTSYARRWCATRHKHSHERVCCACNKLITAGQGQQANTLLNCVLRGRCEHAVNGACVMIYPPT
jgi:hypothetical protein